LSNSLLDANIDISAGFRSVYGILKSLFTFILAKLLSDYNEYSS